MNRKTIGCIRLYSPAIVTLLWGIAYALGLMRTNTTVALCLVSIAVSLYCSITEQRIRWYKHKGKRHHAA